MAIIINRTTSLDGPIMPESMAAPLYEQENQAHQFVITCTRGGSEEALSGSVTGALIRGDGATVALSGSISNGKAVVTLPQSAYVVSGRFALAIFNVVSGTTTAIYAAMGDIRRTSSDTIVDPGSVVPSLAELLAAAENANAAAAAADAAAENALGDFAQEFSATTAYTVGQYVTYIDGKLYRFIADHAAGVWNSSHVALVTVGSELVRSILFRGFITLDDDIDSYRAPGFWYFTDATYGTPTNWPSTTIGTLLVAATSVTGENGTQQYVLDFNGQLWTRYKRNAGFTTWAKVLDNNDITSDIAPVILPKTLSLKATPTTAYDLNDLRAPGMYSIGDVSLASNYPSAETGRLIVFGDLNNGLNRIVQFVIDNDYNVFVRYISAAVQHWFRLGTELRGALTSSDDCNDLTRNGQYTIGNSSSLPSNYPSQLTGKLIVFGDEESNTNRIVQVVVDYKNTVFLRYKSAEWTRWTSLNGKSIVQTVTVKASGGDYTTVPAAVKYVMDNWRDNPSVNYLIKIDPGTYDIASEVVSLIDGGMEHQGLWIPPNATICGAGKDRTIIRFHYSGTDDGIMSDVSAFNMPYESSLMDLTISVENIRYCIHSALQESGVSNSYIDDVTVRLENVKLIHKGFDSQHTPSYSSPGAFGSGSTNGGRKEFYNCDFIAKYAPWFNHNRKNLTKGTEFIFEGCSFVNQTTEVGGGGQNYNSLGFITWADDPQNMVTMRHCYVNKYLQFTIRTDSYGTEDAHNGYYLSSDGDLVVLEPTTNNVHLDDNYIDSHCQKLIASETITAYHPVSKNSLTGVRNYVNTDTEIGIALNSASSGGVCCAKFGGHMLLSMLTSSSFAVGKNLGWNGTAWVEDNTHPIVKVVYGGIVEILD